MTNSWKGEKKKRGKVKEENPKKRRIEEIVEGEHKEEIERYLLFEMQEDEPMHDDMQGRD